MKAQGERVFSTQTRSVAAGLSHAAASPRKRAWPGGRRFPMFALGERTPSPRRDQISPTEPLARA